LPNTLQIAVKKNACGWMIRLGEWQKMKYKMDNIWDKGAKK
jgi:hypothetical protein